MNRAAAVLRRHGQALLLSGLAVLLLTWPLGPRFASALPNARGDGLENTWNIWWAREALLVRHTTPFWAATLYYPDGTSLLFHPLGLVSAPIALPLQAVVDPPAALVLTLLALIWLLAASTYLLLWELVRHRWAALAGGLFVALAPAHLYHLLLAQINLVALFPVPLILVAVLRAARRQRWPWVAAGAAAVVLGGLADWQYLVQALLLAGLLLLVALWRRRRRPRAALRALAWGAAPLALGLVALLPLVLAMIADYGPDVVRPEWQTELRSADLLSLLTPSPYHPLWGEAGRTLYAAYYPRIPYAGGVASFGLTALALAALAAWRWRAVARPWLLLLALGVLLALGPDLHAGGVDLGLPLPYRLFRLIPFMDASRVPAAFLKWTLLALAVLLALGLRTAYARAGRGRRGALTLATLGGLLAVEGLAVPLAVPDRPPVSACYRVLASDPRPGAVLDLPVIDANAPMYFQTLHRRPIAGGDLSRDNPYGFLRSTPVVAQLAHAEAAVPADIFPTPAGAWSRQALAAWGIRWVILRSADAGPNLPRFTAALARVFGQTPPLCSDAVARLWYVDAEPGPLVLALGRGWHEPEHWDGGSPVRWLAEEAHLTVYVPEAGPVRLSFAATAHRHPRTLEVRAGAGPPARLAIGIGLREPAGVTLTLPAGRSLITLRAVEPPDPGGGDDTRLLAIAISDLAIGPPAAAGSP